MRIRVNDIDWHYEEWSESTGQPLLLLHGFTGSAQSWSSFAKLLSPQYRIIALDLPGHGKTPLPDQRLSLWELADALGDFIKRLSSTQVTMLGYSMGGRIALHLALKHQSMLNRLIFIGASPGIADEDERRKRKELDASLAQTIREQGINWFVDFWERQPIFQSQKSLPADQRERLREQRLRNSREGLAYTLENWSSGKQENLLPRLSELTLPVLLIAGEQDSKYTAINQQMHSRLIGNSTNIVIQNAGHAAQLEQPELTAEYIRSFLS